MPEPREIHPYQSFDASFRSRGQGDFRPEVIETADADQLTEDGYGGAPYPRATDLPSHPSMDSDDLNATGSATFVTAVEMVETPEVDNQGTDSAPETTQEPVGIDASASNEGSPVPQVPEFGSEPQSVSVFDADAAALADLI